MEIFTLVVALTGLYCFPVAMIVRTIRGSRSLDKILASILSVVTLISLVWNYLDSKPSSQTRYGAFGYAAVFALSTYLYFMSAAKNGAADSSAGTTAGEFVRENARYLIIGTAILLFAFLYACSHRYEVISDKSQRRVFTLDHWTGEVKTQY